MDKLEIYIYTHRDFEPPVSNPCYKILTCTPLSGKKFETFDTNSGDNIERFGSCYSELNGFYWLWKNVKKEDLPEFVGFSQWRKYFSFLDNVPQDLNKDIIITLKPIEVASVRNHYASCHNVKDLDLCFKIAGEIYPDYLEDIEKTKNSRHLTICNCFIMHKDVFYDYMEWLFSILFKYDDAMGFNCREDVKKYVDGAEGYKKPNQIIAYQYRIEGFLSERLFTLWINHNYPENVNHFNIHQTDFVDRYVG